MRSVWLTISLGFLVAVGIAPAQEKAPREAVRELPLAGKPGNDIRKPVFVATAEEAEKLFGKDKVKDLVDFTAEKILCFAWAGSGQDKLTAALRMEEDRPVVVLTYTRGRTKDLRMHSKCFAVPKQATFRFADDPKESK